jgi:hypothetical protein
MLRTTELAALVEALADDGCALPCLACDQAELEQLWADLGEGPVHPDVTVADLPELRRLKRLAVLALTD